MTLLYVILFFVGLFAVLLIYVFKKTKVGFFIVMGEFGAGKTQNTTAYMKYKDPLKDINISNYYTGYTDHQIMSHVDLVSILNDVYDYHIYINLWEDRTKLYKFRKKEKLIDYENKRNDFIAKYGELKKDIKFNIVLDEASIYFNPRNFKKNFAGENEKLLDFIYQPRKLNVLMFVVLQSPMEVDVKFRRLATYYRKYYKGLKIWRWYKDFYFMNPEEIDLEKAEQVGGGVFMGANINCYPYFPRYDYNTKELIRPGEVIYEKGAIFDTIKKMTHETNIKKSKKLLSFKISKNPKSGI